MALDIDRQQNDLWCVSCFSHYFYESKLRTIDDVQWKVFFTQCIIVFHNHLSKHGAKTVRLDGTVAIDSEVIFLKSDFDLIPEETRIRASKHSRESCRIPAHEPAELLGEDRSHKRASKGGKAASKNDQVQKFRYLPKSQLFKVLNFTAWGASWAENA